VNKNTMKGAIAGALGKIQQTFGMLTGSRKQEVKGVAKRAVGSTQKAVGKVQAAAGKGKRKGKKTARKAGG
jgi:uncharacterized protein YjbJ (UPF0337 family)